MKTDLACLFARPLAVEQVELFQLKQDDFESDFEREVKRSEGGQGE